MEKEKYTVRVEDNYNFIDNSCSAVHSEHDTLEDAIKTCKQIIDASLQHLIEQQKELHNEEIKNSDELYQQWTNFGDYSTCWSTEFDAYKYAKEAAKKIINNKK